jgi:general secretion pathway protein L
MKSRGRRAEQEQAQGDLTIGGRGGVPAAQPNRTILILPASVGRLTRVILPARTEAQARAAAPFLLEQTLATDAAMLHYAVGAAQNADGERLLAIIDKNLLQRFLDRCRSHGADPQIVIFDCCALTPNPTEAKAVETTDRLIISAGGQGGVSLEPALARTVVPRWLQTLSEPIRRIAYVGERPDMLQTALGPSAEVYAAPPASAIEVLASDAVAATEAAPNLRQGDFAPGPAGARHQGRGWRIAAFFAAAAILAQAAVQGVEGHRDAQAASHIFAQAEADFRAMKPDFPVGGDIGAAVRAAQNSAARADVHPVLGVSAPLTDVLRAHPEARLDSLRHEPGVTGVRIVVSSLAPEALDAVAAELRGQGFVVSQSPGEPSFTRLSQTMAIEPMQTEQAP